jgi:hypothetical protein
MKRLQAATQETKQATDTPVLQPLNLCLAARVFMNVQLTSVLAELTSLKKATAGGLFLDALQESLIDVNMRVVKCGCDHCLGGEGSCHNIEPERDEVAHLITTELIQYRRQKHGLQNTTGSCQLYSWFKTKCEEHEVPVPQDAIDHPSRWPGSFNLTTCLGKGLDSGWYVDYRRTTEIGWFATVNQLSYPVQVKSLYPMLHEIDMMGHDREPEAPETFKEWFRGPKGTWLGV